MKQVYKIIVVLLLATSFANAQESFIKYKVKKGENVFQIAKKFNTSKEVIIKLNPECQSGVTENQIMFVPKSDLKSEDIHTVQGKETLFSIARDENVSVEDLADFNKEILTRGLRIGQVLLVPSKKKTLQGNARIINKETVFHVVEAKETKYSISKKYGISIEQLELQNPEIVNGLQEGTKLAINTKEIKTSNDKEELMVAIAEKQVAIERAKTLAAENAKLKSEKRFSKEQVQLIQDSLTVQKEINQKIIKLNGAELNLANLDSKKATSLEKLKVLLDANKNIQSILLTKLQFVVNDMKAEVQDLREKEITDYETSKVLEQKSAENYVKTTEMLQTLKKDLAENRKYYAFLMNDLQRTSTESNNEYKKKVRENGKNYQGTVSFDKFKDYNDEIVKNDLLTKDLNSKIEGINKERSLVLKTKMRKAVFYSEESRVFEDKMALEKLKRYKTEAQQKNGNKPEEKIDLKSAKLENSDFKEVNIENIYSLKDVPKAYYLSLGAFKEASERDNFIKQLIDSGETNATFFYNVNDFTYVVYSASYQSITDALRYYKLKENAKLHQKMKIIRVAVLN